MSTELLPPEVAVELLAASAEATIVANADGEIIFVNREAELLFGYDAAEMLGQPVEILMPGEFRKKHRNHRSQYVAAPRSRPMVAGLELYGRRKNGVHFRAEISLTPVNTEKGLLIATVIREISPADESEAYFRMVLESAPDAMIIVDEHGKIAIVNGQAEQMFGYQRKELLGQPIEQLLPERLRGVHVTHRESFASAPTLRPMGPGLELTARRSDGSEFPVEISLSPIATSTATFVSSVIRDVTDRKQMEEEIIAAQQAAERANKANSAFLAAASHDLRQPVQALSLLNGALRRTVKNKRALEMIENQQHSLTAMTNLLNSLLDISRLDAGAVTPEFEEFPMQRVIDRLSAEFARQAQQKGLEFSSQSCRAIVRSDPNLLSEIIQNFVTNAIRYTDRGNVRLTCVERDGECCINVEDTGVGIDEDQLEAIFQEFHQGAAAKSSKEGFGLGLAIVRRLADLLGHEIGVRSELNKGSCFSVSLPVVDGVNARHDDDEAGLDIAGQNPSGLVVLIEDDVNIANAWGLVLEAEGYRVATAASATEARAVIRHLDEIPALLISDFHLLDGSTGVEAVSEIRDFYDRHIPAFIVSGDTSKVVKDARPLDNCTIMSKPVNTERLLAAACIATRTGEVPQD
ncbi:MAG: PAS domain-containing hybrid sensor histidine kinase/response regulator [Woeseiaceae bacterium]|jgi:PAS domain S-box-containing protein